MAFASASASAAAFECVLLAALRHRGVFTRKLGKALCSLLAGLTPSGTLSGSKHGRAEASSGLLQQSGRPCPAGLALRLALLRAIDAIREVAPPPFSGLTRSPGLSADTSAFWQSLEPAVLSAAALAEGMCASALAFASGLSFAEGALGAVGAVYAAPQRQLLRALLKAAAEAGKDGGEAADTAGYEDETDGYADGYTEGGGCGRNEAQAGFGGGEWPRVRALRSLDARANAAALRAPLAAVTAVSVSGIAVTDGGYGAMGETAADTGDDGGRAMASSVRAQAAAEAKRRREGVLCALSGLGLHALLAATGARLGGGGAEAGGYSGGLSGGYSGGLSCGYSGAGYTGGGNGGYTSGDYPSGGYEKSGVAEEAGYEAAWRLSSWSRAPPTANSGPHGAVYACARALCVGEPTNFWRAATSAHAALGRQLGEAAQRGEGIQALGDARLSVLSLLAELSAVARLLWPDGYTGGYSGGYGERSGVGAGSGGGARSLGEASGAVRAAIESRWLAAGNSLIRAPLSLAEPSLAVHCSLLRALGSESPAASCALARAALAREYGAGGLATRLLCEAKRLSSDSKASGLGGRWALEQAELLWANSGGDGGGGGGAAALALAGRQSWECPGDAWPFSPFCDFAPPRGTAGDDGGGGGLSGGGGAADAIGKARELIQALGEDTSSHAKAALRVSAAVELASDGGAGGAVGARATSLLLSVRVRVRCAQWLSATQSAGATAIETELLTPAVQESMQVHRATRDTHSSVQVSATRGAGGRTGNGVLAALAGAEAAALAARVDALCALADHATYAEATASAEAAGADVRGRRALGRRMELELEMVAQLLEGGSTMAPGGSAGGSGANAGVAQAGSATKGAAAATSRPPSRTGGGSATKAPVPLDRRSRSNLAQHRNALQKKLDELRATDAEHGSGGDFYCGGGAGGAAARWRLTALEGNLHALRLGGEVGRLGSAGAATARAGLVLGAWLSHGAGDSRLLRSVRALLIDEAVDAPKMPLGPFAPHAPALVGGLASTGLAAPPALSQTNTNGSREGGGVVGVSSEVMPTLSAFLFHAAIAFPTPVLYAVLAHADSCADGATGAAANSDGNGEGDVARGAKRAKVGRVEQPAARPTPAIAALALQLSAAEPNLVAAARAFAGGCAALARALAAGSINGGGDALVRAAFI